MTLTHALGRAWENTCAGQRLAYTNPVARGHQRPPKTTGCSVENGHKEDPKQVAKWAKTKGSSQEREREREREGGGGRSTPIIEKGDAV